MRCHDLAVAKLPVERDHRHLEEAPRRKAHIGRQPSERSHHSERHRPEQTTLYSVPPGAAKERDPRRQRGAVFHGLALGFTPGEVPEGEHVVPLGQAALRRSGRDVTLASYAETVGGRLQAAEHLAARGVDAEVIDLRTLKPIDEVAILRSARKTGRLVVVHEAAAPCGRGAEIAAGACEKVFGSPTPPNRWAMRSATGRRATFGATTNA